MKSHVQAVVIGGGVVGCSVLYHLTKFGWKDVALLERKQLTAGSSWHAAGGFHTLNGDMNVAKLQQYTVDLYSEIEEISGQSCGLHLTGGVMMASTKERLDWLHTVHSNGRYMGMNTEIITPSEAKKYYPLIDETQFVGALWHDIEGHLDPSGTTHAFAKAAKKQGAEIYLETCVTDLTQNEDGSWQVVTDKGTIHAEHVVNAAGLWAREVGQMVGVELPVLAMEHQYLITETIPEVQQYNQETGNEVGHMIDCDGELYSRQERDGLLIGTYERGGVVWSKDSTPWDFGHELLQDDIERIAPALEVAFAHFPLLEKTGIQKIVNGPFTFTPDGNPLVGPVPGLKNYWAALGVMAGFSQGGGVGLSLARWMIEGDPGADIWGMDVARYGKWASKDYTHDKVNEFYSNRFRIIYPNEYRPAARPLRTTSLYQTHQQNHAVFGVAAGLEVPLWFAESADTAFETPSYRRGEAFARVAQECRAITEQAGMIDISGFAKYRVTGKNAETWLTKMLAGKIPQQNRLTLSPMLNQQAGLIGDFTLGKINDEEFYIFGSGVAETYHMRWFDQHQAQGVTVQAIGLEWGGLSICGPHSKAIINQLAAIEMGFMGFQQITLGGLQCYVGRVTFTGEHGYEIWCAMADLPQLYQLLTEAGQAHGLKMFGLTALNSTRLEKSFGSLSTEYRPIYTAHQAGLHRFVHENNQNFIGHAAYMQEKQQGAHRRLSTFTVTVDDADICGNEPIMLGDEAVGWVTSGGYGHRTGQSIALGYVPTQYDAQDEFTIEILGKKCVATRQYTPLFDPEAQRMRQ